KTLKDGDTLTVWKLDRLARSLRYLIRMVEDFDERGIQFRSLTEEINTATPGGKLIFHIFGALAEFERGLIIERTREGMKAARVRGIKSGPPPIAVFTCLCGVQVLCSGHESLFARPAAEDPAGLRPAAWPPTGHCGPVRRKPVLRREVAAPAADDRGSGSATARGRRQTQLRC